MTTTNSNTVTKLNKLYDFIEAWEATYAEKFGVDVSQLGAAPVNSTPELLSIRCLQCLNEVIQLVELGNCV